MANKILVLDAGHGLNTAGKRTLNGSRGVVHEWTMNNNVCNKIANILKDYNVTIYRTDDTTGKTDVSLSERVKRCNNYNPHLFVSIHHNAVGVSSWSTATGVETYWHTYGTANDKKVATLIQGKLASKTGLRNRGVKQAQFAVLGCKSDAILVEGGFMDGRDYDYITSDKGQQAYAEAVAEGIIEYLGLTKKVVTTTQKPSTTTSSSQSLTGASFTVKIKVDSLNIRQSASFDSKVVGTVKKGEVYTIVEVKNGLGKLKSGAGYISMGTAYVEKVGTATATPTSKEYQVQITTALLNVRKGAGTNYGLVTTVKKGEVYTIVEEKNGWGLLKSYKASRDGWISLAYTKKK